VQKAREKQLFWPKLASWWRGNRDLRALGLAALWCFLAFGSSACARERADAIRHVETPALRAEPQTKVTMPATAPASPPSSLPPPPNPPPRREQRDPPPTGMPLTPLAEEAAARYLARAWHDVLGKPASEAGLSTLWAHWAHETGRGTRMMGYNFAGLKGHTRRGGRHVWTREAAGPGKKLVRRSFRVYDSPEQGAHDYVSLLLERYRGSLSAARQGRTAGFVAVLAARGYYTDHVDVYQRALTLLARECTERSLARRALESERATRVAP
jgi:Mannosyl-glycoprotein endo-beta-N-acetylglucosaminidase